MEKNMQALDLDDLDQVSGGIRMDLSSKAGLVTLKDEKEKKTLVDAGLWLSAWGLDHRFSPFNKDDISIYQKIKEKVGLQ